jgi:UDP-glucose 4-epimerase
MPFLSNGGASSTFNCGYGRGFSVFEVIDTVKRVSGVDLRVDLRERRAGDPAQIIAASDRARATLGWRNPSSTISAPRRPCPRLGAKAHDADR